MEKQFVQIEIVAKRSTENDAISQKMVEKCLTIAHEAHFRQRDRDGNAVILHPIIVGSMGRTDAEKCVGFLHDVVEDTDWTFDDLLNEGLPAEIVEALRLLTHPKGTDYFDYVRRIIDSGNQTAINVKRNDLLHNIARGKAFGYKDLIAKHEKALRMIEASVQARTATNTVS
jgi:(p)ppGpp synthase/HD superfamily hydrolase